MSNPRSIKNVTAFNLKGASFNRNLTPLTVVVGPNMSGKTSILDAIRLAWAGTTHGVGKRPGEIHAAMASADNLTTSVTFDDGENIERSWTRKGDKVSSQVRNPTLAAPLVLLDADEFFGLSGEARLALLFSRMNLGKEPIQLRVSKLRDRLNGTPAASELLAKKFAPGPQETFQAYLERVIVAVGEEAKEQTAVAKRNREAAQGMIEAQVKATAADAPAYQEDEVLRDKASAQTGLEDVLADRASAETVQKGRAGSLARREKIRATIEKFRPAAASLPAYEKGVADATAKLASYQGAETVRVAQDRLTEILKRRAETVGTKTASEKLLRETETKYAELLNQPCCPTCKTKNANWKAAASAIFEDRKKELGDTVAAADANLQTIGGEQVNAEHALAAARKVEDDVRAAQAGLAEQNRNLESAKNAQAYITETTPELEDLEKAFPADAADRDAEELASLDDRIFEARELVAEQDRRLRSIEDARLEAKRLTETTETRDKAQGLADAYKAGQEELRRVRDEFMADAFKPLIQSVNRYAAGILKTPLEFRANSLGRMSDKKQWIPTTSFSGTETAILLAGVQLALGAESPAKVAVVDELGRLDADRKRQLIRNVAAAIEAGDLQQFIGIDVADTAYADLLKPDAITTRPLPLTILRTA